jgi:signal transduction histidine kinase
LFGIRARFLVAFLAIATLGFIPALRHLYIVRHQNSVLTQIYTDTVQDIVALQRVSGLMAQIKDTLSGAGKCDPQSLEAAVIAVETEVSLFLTPENQSRYGDHWSREWRSAIEHLRRGANADGRNRLEGRRETEAAFFELERILGRSLVQEANEYDEGLRGLVELSQHTELRQHWWTMVLAFLALGSAILLADNFSAPLRRVLWIARSRGGNGELLGRSDGETVVSYIERLSAEKSEADHRANATLQVLDSMSDGVVVLDRNGFIINFNHAVRQIFADRAGELRGAACIAVPELRPIATALGLRRATEAFEMDEFSISSDHHEPAEFSVKVSPITNAGNRVDGCVIVLRDETLRRSLMRRVAEQQYRLESAERLAAVGTMGAIVAHKFSQPITSVRLFLQQAQRMLGQVACPEAVHQNLGASISELSRASEMIRAVLSRGQRDDVVQDVVINAALQRARAALEFRLKESGGEIRIVCDPFADCTVSGPMLQIDEVFYTLFHNSLQAARPGTSPQVVSYVDARDDVVDVRIVDNGNGISREHLDQIFDSFFSTKGDGEGVGLGLAIVQQVVKGLGGRIEVSSTVGVGTTFHVIIPRNRQVQDTQGVSRE